MYSIVGASVALNVHIEIPSIALQQRCESVAEECR